MIIGVYMVSMAVLFITSGLSCLLSVGLAVGAFSSCHTNYSISTTFKIRVFKSGIMWLFVVVRYLF